MEITVNFRKGIIHVQYGSYCQEVSDLNKISKSELHLKNHSSLRWFASTLGSKFRSKRVEEIIIFIVFQKFIPANTSLSTNNPWGDISDDNIHHKRMKTIYMILEL